MGFIIKDGGISLNGFRIEQLHGDPAMLSPAKGTLSTECVVNIFHNSPCVVIWSSGNGTPVKDSLILQEIWFAAGEDCAVGHQQILGNVCIRDHNE
jgi:hypothetical protein